MELVRKLAWAALLAGTGAPSTPPAAPRLSASAPAQSPKPATPAKPQAPASAPDAAPPATTWPLDLDDDEFEGEGWSFWPLAPGRD